MSIPWVTEAYREPKHELSGSAEAVTEGPKGRLGDWHTLCGQVPVWLRPHGPAIPGATSKLRSPSLLRCSGCRLTPPDTA